MLKSLTFDEIKFEHVFISGAVLTLYAGFVGVELGPTLILIMSAQHFFGSGFLVSLILVCVNRSCKFIGSIHNHVMYICSRFVVILCEFYSCFCFQIVYQTRIKYCFFLSSCVTVVVAPYFTTAVSYSVLVLHIALSCGNKSLCFEYVLIMLIVRNLLIRRTPK